MIRNGDLIKTLIYKELTQDHMWREYVVRPTKLVTDGRDYSFAQYKGKALAMPITITVTFNWAEKRRYGILRAYDQRRGYMMYQKISPKICKQKTFSTRGAMYNFARRMMETMVEIQKEQSKLATCTSHLTGAEYIEFLRKMPGVSVYRVSSPGKGSYTKRVKNLSRHPKTVRTQGGSDENKRNKYYHDSGRQRDNDRLVSKSGQDRPPIRPGRHRGAVGAPCHV